MTLRQALRALYWLAADVRPAVSTEDFKRTNRWDGVAWLQQAEEEVEVWD